MEHCKQFYETSTQNGSFEPLRVAGRRSTDLGSRSRSIAVLARLFCPRSSLRLSWSACLSQSRCVAPSRQRPRVFSQGNLLEGNPRRASHRKSARLPDPRKAFVRNHPICKPLSGYETHSRTMAGGEQMAEPMFLMLETGEAPGCMEGDGIVGIIGHTADTSIPTSKDPQRVPVAVRLTVRPAYRRTLQCAGS